MTFDFVIICISIIDLMLSYYVYSQGGSGGEGFDGMNVSFIRVLRLARVARSGKLARYFEDLFLLVAGLAKALRTIIWVLLLLGIVIYICAIFLTQTIGHDPYYQYHDDEAVRETWSKFRNMGRSMFWLFVIMTLEAWADIVSPLNEINAMWTFFFIGYILITHFTILNLFVGVIVEHIQRSANTADLELMMEVRTNQQSLYQELHETFRVADSNGDGHLTTDEFRNVAATNDDVKGKLDRLGVKHYELEWLFDVLDSDDSGSLSIDEFVDGVLRTKESEFACQLMQMQYTILRELSSLKDGQKELKDGQHGRKGHKLNSKLFFSAQSKLEHERDQSNGAGSAPKFTRMLSQATMEMQRSSQRKRASIENGNGNGHGNEKVAPS